jgi:hypothetical protein
MAIKPIPPLYKYLTADRALQILCTGEIRFTQPAFLNDPYESHLTIDRHEEIAKAQSDLKELAPELSEERIRINAEEIWMDTAFTQYRELRSNLGVLSLTEDPINLLMWAHYGD